MPASFVTSVVLLWGFKRDSECHSFRKQKIVHVVLADICLRMSGTTTKLSTYANYKYMSCLRNLTKVHRSPEWKMQRSIFVKQSQDIFPRFRATVVSRRRCDTIVLWFQTLVGIDHAMLCSWTLTFQNCLINVVGYHRYL